MKLYTKILTVLTLSALLSSATACSIDLQKNYVSATQEVSESFTSISLSTKSTEVFIRPSEDGECKIVSYAHKKMQHTVCVEENTLVISLIDNRAWYDKILSISEANLTVYLPQNQYENISVRANTGDVSLPSDFNFTNISLSTSTGDIKCYASATELTKLHATTGDIIVSEVSTQSLQVSCSTGYATLSSIVCEGDITVQTSTGNKRLNGVNCKNLTLVGSTGDCNLKNVVAEQKISIHNSTGDVRFEDCDALEIYARTSTGNVKGNFLSNKIFDAHSNTGKVSVPQSQNGGLCEIRVDTGDILFTAPANG